MRIQFSISHFLLRWADMSLLPFELNGPSPRWKFPTGVVPRQYRIRLFGTGFDTGAVLTLVQKVTWLDAISATNDGTDDRYWCGKALLRI